MVSALRTTTSKPSYDGIRTENDNVKTVIWRYPHWERQHQNCHMMVSALRMTTSKLSYDGTRMARVKMWLSYSNQNIVFILQIVTVCPICPKNVSGDIFVREFIIPCSLRVHAGKWQTYRIKIEKTTWFIFEHLTHAWKIHSQGFYSNSRWNVPVPGFKWKHCFST